MTLAVNKVDEHSLSNTACHEYLTKKTKLMLYQPLKEAFNYLTVVTR